jgi:UDP-glucose 4-epimerase
MRILITGGAGYIGSVVSQELTRCGHDLVVYDNLSHGHRSAVPAACEFICGDVGDSGRLEHVFRNYSIEAVMHFAAFIEAGESMTDPGKYFRNNSANALNLLEVMLRHGVRKFVLSSTAAVYGNPESVPVREDAALSPANAYGESKLMVEQMLAWFHRAHRLRYCSLRYFNAAGAVGDLGEAHHPESHLIPLLLHTALGKRRDFAVFGADYPTPDGTCVRDFIHVADLAQAHRLALDALADRDRLIYNLGNGAGFSVREVLEVARKITGQKIPAQERPRRPGDPPVLVASSEKIRKELNWQPRYPDLESMVSSAWQFLQKYPDGLPGELHPAPASQDGLQSTEELASLGRS